MAVSQITYEIPWTKDNDKAMKDAALKKYGQVSSNRGIDRVAAITANFQTAASIGSLVSISSSNIP